MKETRNNACYTYKSHGGTARCPPLWRVTGASQTQFRQRHVATRVWKVLDALAKRIARALIVPIGISRKGFGRIADATSVKDKPLQYPHFVTYFECFHQHRKGIREIKTRRGMKQTRHQQSSKSTFSHANSKNLQHCDSHRNELSRDCHPIGDVIINKRSDTIQREQLLAFGRI